MVNFRLFTNGSFHIFRLLSRSIKTRFHILLKIAQDSVLFFSSSTVERTPRPNFSSLLVRFSGPLKTRCTHEYNDVHFDFFSFFFVFQGCSEV